jgi:prolyl 4-hydroxylase
MYISVALAVVVVTLLAIWFWNLPSRKARGFTDKTAAWDPPVEVGQILTPEECKAIIDFAEPKFSRSTLVAADAVDDTRTSETAWLSRDHDLSRKILAKARELTGMPFENCEDIQVVRYKPGTYYKPHHDACCEDNEHCLKFEDEGGQRVGTLLVYLNDDYEEGWTAFPDANLKLKAPPGGGVFFRPLGKDDWRCHPMALHGGMPVKNGTKYLCNVWVREGTFR